MSYIAVTLNHFKAVKDWLHLRGAKAELDPDSFELEVTARNRYFRLHPQFLARSNGRLVHSPHLNDDVTGFIGWLPYRPASWPLTADKLNFKDFAVASGLTTPRYSRTVEEAPDHDYLFKRSMGSFGYDLYGPYRAGEAPPSVPANGPEHRGRLFVEEFVQGRNVKAWFWGHTPFFLQRQDYPLIQGDGVSTASMLVRRRLELAGQKPDGATEQAAIESALAFQRIAPDTVLPAGSQAWFDYRYGRVYQPTTLTPQNDDTLAGLDADTRAQVAEAGGIAGDELLRQLQVPVLYTLDGIQRQDGRILWVEINSNPILAPAGYAVMLDDLFGYGAPAMAKASPAELESA